MQTKYVEAVSGPALQTKPNTSHHQSFANHICRSNRSEIPWTPEAGYVVPVAEKDCLPHASEGVRPVMLVLGWPSLKRTKIDELPNSIQVGKLHNKSIFKQLGSHGHDVVGCGSSPTAWWVSDFSRAFIDRSLSDVQETAQLLAGEALPLAPLSAILGKSDVKEKYDTCLLINLTSYDGWVEKNS